MISHIRQKYKKVNKHINNNNKGYYYKIHTQIDLWIRIDYNIRIFLRFIVIRVRQDYLIMIIIIIVKYKVIFYINL